MDEWAASAERFNKMHGAPGSGKGGQFVSSSSGGGTKTKPAKTAKAPHNVPHHPVSGPAAPAGDHAARRRQLTTQIHADEAKITTLEHELHRERQALKTSASQAAHAKAQAAAAKRAGKAAAHHHQQRRHAHHHHRAQSHRHRVAQLVEQIGHLRDKVKSLRKQVAAL